MKDYHVRNLAFQICLYYTIWLRFADPSVCLKGGYIRCAFSDGEQEDLTLSGLRTAVRAQELREQQAIMKNDNNSNDNSVQDDDRSTNDGLLDLDMADEIIPEDDTAASTYHLVTQANTKKTKSDNGDDEGAWLTKVAELLATKGKSKQKKQKPVEEVDFSVQNGAFSDKESQGFVALSSIAKEFRHGCKVINTIDEVKIVGQVSYFCWFCSSPILLSNIFVHYHCKIGIDGEKRMGGSHHW